MSNPTNAFFRHAFLRHGPHRRARMMPPGREIKYLDQTGPITDAEIADHLAGHTTYAVPMAHAGLAHLLALDIDAGGLDAIHALLAATTKRGLWAFGQYTPRPGEERGYVWIPFEDLSAATRLQLLGEQLIAEIARPTWRIESRAHGADTRLPLGRHTHSNSFGWLVLPNEPLLTIDDDPADALQRLQCRYRENSCDLLPAAPAVAPAPRTHSRGGGRGITIQHYNNTHDLIELLISYGAKRAHRQTFLCPFHDDRNASLGVFVRGDRLVCRCLSQHSGCPLSQRAYYDAFDVFCIGEQVTPEEALRQLNGHTTKHTPPPIPPRPVTPPPRTSTPPPLKQPPPQPPERVTTPTQTQHTLIISAVIAGQLSAKQIAVLHAIISAAINGRACQSVEHYAEHAGCSERTTRYTLRKLESLGYLRRIDRSLDGQTNIYEILPGGGGQNVAPTWNHDHDLNSDSKTDRGGSAREGAREGAQDSAREGARGTTRPEQMPEVPAPASANGASYDPSADDMTRPAPAQRREWHSDLRPSELYALLYSRRDMHERWSRCAERPPASGDDDQAQAELDIADVAEVAAAAAAPPRTRRQPPSDPVQRRRYYALLGKAKRSQSQAQARRLRELAAQLLEEVEILAGDDQVEPAQRPRPRWRSPFVRVDVVSSVIAPAPASNAAAQLGEEQGCGLPPLSVLAEGWLYEVVGVSWRGVHPSGYVTRLYVNPEAVRRAIGGGDVWLSGMI